MIKPHLYSYSIFSENDDLIIRVEKENVSFESGYIKVSSISELIDILHSIQEMEYKQEALDDDEPLPF